MIAPLIAPVTAAANFEAPRPNAPIDCNIATIPPAATPPPAAIAFADMIVTAVDPAAMPELKYQSTTRHRQQFKNDICE